MPAPRLTTVEEVQWVAWALRELVTEHDGITAQGVHSSRWAHATRAHATGDDFPAFPHMEINGVMGPIYVHFPANWSEQYGAARDHRTRCTDVVRYLFLHYRGQSLRALVAAFPAHRICREFMG
jgi:hypothetical protein